VKKKCARCAEVLNAEQFRPNPKMRDGLDSWCRACHNQATQAWREKHPERVAEYNAARRVLGPDGFYTKTCVRCGEQFRTKRKHTKLCGLGSCRNLGLDPSKTRARKRNQNHVRRVLLRDVERPSSSEIYSLLATAETCPLCGTELSDVHLDPAHKHLDHIMPLAAGGAHVLSNLRVICRACNLRRPRDGSDVAA
jgi:5-methylcytosine-specific restriction endonuclease McrA